MCVCVCVCDCACYLKLLLNKNLLFRYYREKSKITRSKKPYILFSSDLENMKTSTLQLCSAPFHNRPDMTLFSSGLLRTEKHQR